MTHKTIHLHVYKQKVGIKGVAKDEKGKILNDNHLVKLTHGTKEWANYLKHLKINAFVKVEVKGFLNKVNEDGTFKYEDVSESLLKEVHTALHGEVDRKLTSEEKITLLEEKIEALTSKEAPKAKETPKAKEVDPELVKAREDYAKVFGKKGGPSWSVEQIREKIKNK